MLCMTEKHQIFFSQIDLCEQYLSYVLVSLQETNDKEVSPRPEKCKEPEHSKTLLRQNSVSHVVYASFEKSSYVFKMFCNL